MGVDAFLDVLLSKHLAAGKLFVGQKLRIWGAILCGWVGPVSPLEVCESLWFSSEAKLFACYTFCH